MFISGIRVWTVGAGPEGQAVGGEIKSVAFAPSYSVTGGATALCSKSVFDTMSASFIKSKNFIQVCVKRGLRQVADLDLVTAVG